MIVVLQHRVDQRTVEVLVESACRRSRARSSRWCWWSCKTKSWNESSERTKRLQQRIRDSQRSRIMSSSQQRIRSSQRSTFRPMSPMLLWLTKLLRSSTGVRMTWGPTTREDQQKGRGPTRARSTMHWRAKALGVFWEVTEVFSADFDFWQRFKKSSQHVCLQSWQRARRSDEAGRQPRRAMMERCIRAEKTAAPVHGSMDHVSV